MAFRALILVKLLLRSRFFCLNTGGLDDPAMIAAAVASAVASSVAAASETLAAMSLLLLAPAALAFGAELRRAIAGCATMEGSLRATVTLGIGGFFEL